MAKPPPASSAACAVRSTPRSRRPVSLRLLLSRGLVFFAMIFAGAEGGRIHAAETAERSYDIRAADASEALKQFVAQSGEQVLFLVNKVRGVTTRAVRGQFAARAALDQMLAGTELYAVQDQRTGALMVNREPPATERAKEPTAPTVDRAPPAHRAVVSDNGEVVRLPVFTIRSERDASYVGKQALSTTRIGVELADVPQSVVVLNKAFLSDLNPTILAKALNYVGGAQTGTINWSVDRYMIRGFVGEGDYVDGFRTQTDKNTDINLVDHIEIIKGPSAIFIGNQSNTVGGVINKISKTPTDYRVGTITVQFGSWDTNRADLDVGGPLTIDRRLRYRLLLAGQDSKGYYDYTYEKRFSFLPMLAYRFNPDSEAWLKFEKFDSHYSAYNGIPLDGRTRRVLAIPASRNLNEDTPNNWRTDWFWRLWGQLTTRLSDNVAVRLAAFDSADYQRRVESILLPTGGTVANGVLTPQYVVPPNFVNGQLVPRTTTAINPDYQPRREVQHDWIVTFAAGPTRHKFLLGGDVIDYPESARSYSAGPNSTASSNAIDPFNPRQPGTVSVNFAQSPVNAIEKSQTFAKIYALETAEFFNNRLILSLGASRNRFAFSQSSLTVNQNTGVSAAPVVVPPQLLYRNLVQYGAVVKPWANVSIFYGYNKNFSSNGLSPTSVLLPPQEGKQKELGVKSTWFDGHLSASVNFFDVVQLNNSVPSFPQTTPLSNALVAGTHSRGFDGDISAQPTKNIDLVASFAWFKAHVPLPAPWNAVPQPYDGAIHADLPVNNVSQHNAALWSRYKFTETPLRGLSVGLGISYLAKRAITDNNNEEFYGYVPARTLVDALLGYETKHVRWQLNVDNLFNRSYIYAARSNQVLVPGTPTNVRASVTLRF
jgi:iron complex outermembrane recepter protein